MRKFPKDVRTEPKHEAIPNARASASMLRFAKTVQVFELSLARNITLRNMLCRARGK